jgi:hypothetical protein
LVCAQPIYAFKTTREIAVARTPATAARTDPPRQHSAIQDAFIRRTTHAIERLAMRVDEATLVEAMAAPTDFGTLARVLTDFGAIGNAVAEIDPAGVELAREIEHRENVVRRAGGMLSADDAGQLLHTTRQAVDKRRRGKTLLAIRQGGDWLYPRAQFHEQEAIPGLPDIIRGFEASGPWVTLEFLVTEDSVLDGLAPCDALLRRPELRARVMTLVRGHEGGEGFA